MPFYRLTPCFVACVLTACTAVPRPLVEAHRGAAGYYPQNSRTAMLASIDDGYDAIELDLALTRDLVPVLSHDPWVHDVLCELTDGTGVGHEEELVGLHTLEELQERFVCGGLPDPNFPNAVVHGESIMAFDELIEAVKYEADPGMVVHLDIKSQPGITPEHDEFAEAIMGRWGDADLPNPFYVSAGTAEAIGAFEDWGRVNGREVPTSLSWPRLPTSGSAVEAGIASEVLGTLGLQDPVKAAREAGADGLAIQWEVASREMVRVVKAEGLTVRLWTLDSKSQLEHHALWGVDSLITNYPADLP